MFSMLEKNTASTRYVAFSYVFFFLKEGLEIK
jgi:hypothetical protein